MPCSTCLKFPLPISNYDEVAVNEPMQSELYRCRACGQLIRTGALERAISYLSSGDAGQQFPGFDPSAP
ncbi:hypothetical protein BLA17378_00866 [Burkholderia aenigmatica]|uniref:Uncharacterized protein n=1 Tax=Burkholderia aenigmatica TaxID=2015348 RepID=A0ABY6XPR0_9BURK|nr:hypothetical protein BLA17378_00866 [Burkholderia aenigmatica]